MRFNGTTGSAVGLGLVASLACQGPSDSTEEPQGQGDLSVALGVSGLDVTALRIDIVAADADCTGEVIESQTIELPHPSPADEAAGAAANRQASAVLLVPAGEVRVCVTPLVADEASERCRPADGIARVETGQTTNVELVLQCGDSDDGALNAVVTFNEAPRIEQLRIDPGEVITTCQAATLSLQAADIDGDALSYAWSVGDPLRLRPYEGTLESAGSQSRFSASVAGEYLVNVSVDDGHGGQTALSVTLEVVEEACGAAR